MVVFFAITLGISILGLVGLLTLKRWELTTGNVFFAQVRPRVGELLHRGLMWVEQVAPRLVREFVSRSYYAARKALHLGTAWSVLTVERGLEKSLHTLRKTTDAPQSGADASEFLREVSEHKRKILKSSRKKAIYEE